MYLSLSQPNKIYLFLIMPSISKKRATQWFIINSLMYRKSFILPPPQHFLLHSLLILFNWSIKVVITAQATKMRLQEPCPLICTCWSFQRGERKRLGQEKISPHAQIPIWIPPRLVLAWGWSGGVFLWVSKSSLVSTPKQTQHWAHWLQPEPNKINSTLNWNRCSWALPSFKF